MTTVMSRCEPTAFHISVCRDVVVVNSSCVNFDGIHELDLDYDPYFSLRKNQLKHKPIASTRRSACGQALDRGGVHVGVLSPPRAVLVCWYL